MTVRRSLVAQGLLLAATLAFTVASASRLPDRVVIHWGLDGQPNGWGSKWVTLALMPLVLASMAALTAVLPAISPREYRMEKFGKTYGWVMFLVAALMAAMHVVIVLKTAGASFDIGQTLMVVLFAVWILLGNVIGRVGRNYFMGIRTPWTLSNEQVWRETHRYAGRLWVAGGVIGLIGALAGAPFTGLLALLLVISLVPVAKSYSISKRLG